MLLKVKSLKLLTGKPVAILHEKAAKQLSVYVGERIRTAIKDHGFYYYKDEIRLTMSFGIAEFPIDAKTCDELIKKADFSMYRAKDNGRDRVELY